MIKLRDYQQDVVNKIYNSWNAGNRNVCAVLPTGSGKTHVFSKIIADHKAIGQNCAAIAHRNELVSQMSCNLATWGIPHKVIASNTTVSQIIHKHREKFGKSFVNPSERTAVIGVDTFVSRIELLNSWAQQIHLWVQDEGHHLQVNNKWGKAISSFINARGLAVTATPNRADGHGLGRWADGFMDDIVIGPTTRFLINKGYLADYEIVCPKSDIKVEDEQLSSNGDWSLQTLKKAAKKSKIVGDVVTNYLKYAKGRQAIVFATDVDTAEEIATDFRASGIEAVSLNGKTVSSYREQSVKNFESGKIQVLVNVDLFDEGFNVESCDVVIMARPTASLAKFLQQCGRALRPLPGKTALIIDHVSNVIRHGLPDMEREWTLNRRERRAKSQPDPNEIPLTVCPNCLKPYEKFRTVCPYCGFEKPLPDPQARSIEMVEGDLILLTREMLELMRRGTVLEAPGDVAARVNRVAGPIAAKGVANRQMEKIAAQSDLKEAIAQWAAIERLKGFNDREIYKKFYLSTGMDVLSALDGSHSRQEFTDMANRIKEWWEK